jgi:hypothetical protein
MVGGKWRSDGLNAIGLGGAVNDEIRMTNDEGMTKKENPKVRRDIRSLQD